MISLAESQGKAACEGRSEGFEKLSLGRPEMMEVVFHFAKSKKLF